MAIKHTSKNTSTTFYQTNLINEDSQQRRTAPNHLAPFDLRVYHIAIKTFKSRIRMLRKANLIPDVTHDRLAAALNILASRSLDELEINGNEHRSIHNYILSQIIHLTDVQTAEYLSLCYSEREQHSISMRLWLRDAAKKVEDDTKGFILQLLSLAEDNLKISMPGQINGENIQPVSLGYYFVSYAASLYRSYADLRNLYVRNNQMPASSGSMGGTSLILNSNSMARYLKFAAVKRNAADSLADDSFILEFCFITNVLASQITRIMRQILAWAQQYNAFITFTAPGKIVSNSGIQGGNMPEQIAAVISRATRICGNVNSINTASFSSPCPLSSDYQLISEKTFECFEDINYMLSVLPGIFASIQPNKRIMKEAAQSPEGFYQDIVAWLLKNTEIGLHQSIRVAKEIINQAIVSEQKISLMELSDLQKIEPSITSGILSAVSPVRAAIARRSIDGTSPVKIRKYIRQLIKKINSPIGEYREITDKSVLQSTGDDIDINVVKVLASDQSGGLN